MVQGVELGVVLGVVLVRVLVFRLFFSAIALAAADLVSTQTLHNAHNSEQDSSHYHGGSNSGTVEDWHQKAATSSSNSSLSLASHG